MLGIWFEVFLLKWFLLSLLKDIAPEVLCLKSCPWITIIVLFLEKKEALSLNRSTSHACFIFRTVFSWTLTFNMLTEASWVLKWNSWMFCQTFNHLNICNIWPWGKFVWISFGKVSSLNDFHLWIISPPVEWWAPNCLEMLCNASQIYGSNKCTSKVIADFSDIWYYVQHFEQQQLTCTFWFCLINNGIKASVGFFCFVWLGFFFATHEVRFK